MLISIVLKVVAIILMLFPIFSSAQEIIISKEVALKVKTVTPIILFGESAQSPRNATYQGLRELPAPFSHRRGRLFDINADNGKWSLWLSTNNSSIIYAVTERGQHVNFSGAEVAGYGSAKPEQYTLLDYRMGNAHFTGACKGLPLQPDGRFTAECFEQVNGEGVYEVTVYLHAELKLVGLMRHQEWLSEGQMPFGFVLTFPE